VGPRRHGPPALTLREAWRAAGRDEELRRRLRRRFGGAIDSWLEELPDVLGDLAARWRLELDALIPRGSMSAVARCRVRDGPAAVLKLSPDRERLAAEARVLAAWDTPHVPAVLEEDEGVGALLLEAVEPGTALDEARGYPPIERLGELMRSLHAGGVPASHRPVAARVAYLFDSGRKHYERAPQLVELVPKEVYERGRDLALRLAEDAPTEVLLHGDLTPVNVLDGGAERGLVAVDPAPCVGDPAFDAVDLVLWRVEDAAALAARADRLAAAMGADPQRLLAWCAAFAGMTALEAAENGTATTGQLETYVDLAGRA
jgi:streptomycin 6-kinase